MECLFSDFRSKKHLNCVLKYFRSKKHKKILVFSSLIRTFAPDKSIKIAILERNYD